jgi:hypothetical protein
VLSNSPTLASNGVDWVNGDTVELPLHPNPQVLGGHFGFQTWWPGEFPGSAAGVSFSGVLSDAYGFTLNNMSSSNLYIRQGGSGVLGTPNGYRLMGPWYSAVSMGGGYDLQAQGVRFDGPPGGGVRPGYYLSPFQIWTRVGSGIEHQFYDQNSGKWIFTVGGNSSSYTLGPTGFISPVQIQSTVSSGIPPFEVKSTTPVANLAATPTTYNAAGKQQTNTHIVADQCSLGMNCNVALAGDAAFSSATSYQCAATDATSAGVVRVSQISGSAVVFSGTGTDVIHFICVGY